MPIRTSAVTARPTMSLSNPEVRPNISSRCGWPVYRYVEAYPLRPALQVSCRLSDAFKHHQARKHGQSVMAAVDPVNVGGAR